MYRLPQTPRRLKAGLRFSAMAIFCALHGTAWAGDWFNPAFLSSDAAQVADLSRFENGSGQAPGVYRVDIWLNDDFVTTASLRFDAVEAQGEPAAEQQQSSEQSAVDDGTGLTPCLTLKWLKRLGVDTFNNELKHVHDESQCIDVKRIFPGTTTYYDFAAQKLTLTFPQAALQNSAHGYIPPEEWDQGINAGLLNYALTGSKGQASSSYYLNLTSGLNLGAWRLRNNSAWSDYTSHGASRKAWQNISTYVERTIIPLKSELVAGDSSTSDAVFDSLGFRGVRLYSSEPMYPDSQQGYAPTIRGIAAGRSRVTVRQNGYVIYQNTVQAGAFEISDLNPTASSGDLQVTVESDAGSVQTFTVPYSSVSVLQREGRTKFDLVAGRYRSGLAGKKDLPFTQVTAAHGFKQGLTLFGGAQLAKNYQSTAAGVGQNLGDFGAVSVDVTSARSHLSDGSEHSGQSARFLYAKSLNTLGITFQLMGYRYSTRGFYTLDEAAWRQLAGYQYEWKEDADGSGQHYEPVSYHNLRRSKKGRFQINLAQQVSDIGSLNFSVSRQDYWNATGSDEWLQAGFASSWHGVSYSLAWSLNRSSGMPQTNRLVSLNISVPLGRWLGHGMAEHHQLNSIYTTAQASQDQRGETQMQTGVSGTLLNDGSLSYSVMQGHSRRAGSSGNVNLGWQGGAGKAAAGYSYARGNHNLNWNLSGGVVAHANGITFSQPLGDTNVLIKAPGAKAVHVENETGVKTDWRGYAVMPYATVYRRNRIALDVNSLDRHTDLDDNVQNVVPTEGAIVRAEYQAHVGLRALFTLLHDNHPVPFGTVVTEKSTGASGIVGETGEVYLNGIPQKGQLDMVWGASAAAKCSVSYRLPADKDKPVLLESLSCNTGAK